MPSAYLSTVAIRVMQSWPGTQFAETATLLSAMESSTLLRIEWPWPRVLEIRQPKRWHCLSQLAQKSGLEAQEPSGQIDIKQLQETVPQSTHRVGRWVCLLPSDDEAWHCYSQPKEVSLDCLRSQTTHHWMEWQTEINSLKPRKKPRASNACRVQ